MKTQGTIIKTIVTILMFMGFGISMVVVHRLVNSATPNLIVFNVSIGAFALLGLSVMSLVCIIERTQDEKSAWIFWSLLVITYIGVVCDSLSWVVDGQIQYTALNYTMNVGSFLVIPIELVAFWSYQNSVFMDQSGNIKVIKRAIYVLLFVDMVFRLVGSVNGYIFYINANGEYVSGPGYVFTSIYPAIVIGCCAFETFEKKLPIEKKLVLLSFGVMPIIIVLISVIAPLYSFLYEAVFLDLILVYGVVQSRKGVELIQQNMKMLEQKQELSEQKTQIMISQIKPHFVYNTLTAIYQLCDIDTKLAQEMIQHFSTYLRANMDSMELKMPIPFEKELAHTKNYLAIELVRFRDILNVVYDIEVTNFVLPALTLQPLVENAVKYGIRSREEGGTIKISTRQEADKIYITVSDDGMGFDVNAKKEDGQSHIGIENTRRRLELMMNAKLEIESQIGVGTTVTIILEKQNEFIIS